MPGSPIKRRIKEQNAIKEIHAKAVTQNRVKANKLPRVRFSQELADQACELIAQGLPIDDSVLNQIVITPGVATRLRINPSSFYEWQKKHADFAKSIAHAREESSHRIADRIQSLADVALSEPAMANSCRVAADILKWSAMVRNPKHYSEKIEHTVAVESYADVLTRINAQIEQEEAEELKALPAPCAE